VSGSLDTIRGRLTSALVQAAVGKLWCFGEVLAAVHRSIA